MLLPRNRASRFPSFEKESHRCPPSRPHPLPACSLWRRKMGTVTVLWGEGVWVPNTAKGPRDRHIHSRAGVSPGRVTSAWMAPQPDAASPPPQPRRHHLLVLLLFAHSSTFHSSGRLLAGYSHPRRPRATSAYVSPCACAVAQRRPLAGLRPRAVFARLPLAHALCP